MGIAKWIVLAVCVYFTALPLMSKKTENASDEGEKN
jgi:hypothetical protein